MKGRVSDILDESEKIYIIITVKHANFLTCTLFIYVKKGFICIILMSLIMISAKFYHLDIIPFIKKKKKKS